MRLRPFSRSISMLHSRSVPGLITAVALVAAAALAHAGEVRWKEEKYAYTAKGKNLKEFLREFGASQGLVVVVSKDVEGTVNGKFDLLPSSLMDLMAASFGFTWYAEGNVVYVLPANDVRSEVVRMGSTPVARLRQALQQLDIPDRRFPILYDGKQNTALVSGPSRYVDLVVQTSRSLDQVSAPGAGAEVRVFPLRYAWAGDFVYNQGNREQTIPGVASVLSQVYGNAPSSTGRGAAQGTRSRGPLDALRGLGLVGPGVSALDRGRGTANDPSLQGSGINGGFGGGFGGGFNGNFGNFGGGGDGLPQFRADGRMNAVIVRDLPERMRAHEATVRSLDIKPGLVEIEVRIIEINADAVDSLGIDWRLRTGRLDVQLGRGNLPTLAWGSALADGAPQVGPNGPQVLNPSPSAVLTTVLGDAGRFLIARVNALAQEGRANMLASPKIMTLDNVEAVMENLNTFFVRVAGNLDVNLFDVSVGTSLRVTPLIVPDAAQQQVKLAIRIEDGALTGQSVDQVPVIRRSTITTQSFIGDGQALLIAGYSQESDTDDQVGVPGLSTLPVLGRLFKYTEKRKSRLERLYLLTPKVVSF